MMLCFGNTRIAHATLHQSVRQALEAITRERVGRVIDETARTLQRMGIAAPRIAVSGLNPHAGEGGLFGREEIDIINPAIDAAVADGIAVAGPFGADTMFHMQGFDAFVVMLHDQGHIAAKVMAEHAAAALTIGTPILFSSVAHGSAHDIAGKGVADPKAMIEAVLRMAGALSHAHGALGRPLTGDPHERRHDPRAGAQRAAAGCRRPSTCRRCGNDTAPALPGCAARPAPPASASRCSSRRSSRACRARAARRGGWRGTRTCRCSARRRAAACRSRRRARRRSGARRCCRARARRARASRSRSRTRPTGSARPARRCSPDRRRRRRP